MAAIPTLRNVRSALPLTSPGAVYPFFTSPLQCARNAPLARFSTSPALWKGGKGDNSKNRAVSPMRRTGVRKRQTLSVKQKDFANQQLPMPVKPTSEVVGDPDHGLWEFFKDRKLLRTPAELSQHGRAWTVFELRERDWETLQQLWWVCVKERNRLATEELTRVRHETPDGDTEAKQRDETIQKTMKAIIDTLVERNNAYQEAYELAKNDPSIDLYRPDHQYQESTYDLNDMYVESNSLDNPTGAVPKQVLDEQISNTSEHKEQHKQSSTV